MKPEIKKQWVAALRSGEYKQGKGQLKNQPRLQTGITYCCLGVLCDLHSKATAQKWDDDPLGAHWVNSPAYMGYTGTLNAAVMGWAGLDNPHGARVTIGHNEKVLTTHNDRGRTFAQIADAIEEQL